MPPDRARQIEVKLLQRLADHGGAHLAAVTGLSEATVSRLKNEHLANFAKLLTALGLKVVDEGVKCYQPDIVNAWRTLAKAGIDHDSAEVE
jgi:hypothetical protein